MKIAHTLESPQCRHHRRGGGLQLGAASLSAARLHDLATRMLNAHPGLSGKPLIYAIDANGASALIGGPLLRRFLHLIGLP